LFDRAVNFHCARYCRFGREKTNVDAADQAVSARDETRSSGGETTCRLTDILALTVKRVGGERSKKRHHYN
jgi:hypothetical protein